ncbi:MAG: hypothetical protein Q9184_007041 [Pyrenodesmia sp. 2 TL-2023]
MHPSETEVTLGTWSAMGDLTLASGLHIDCRDDEGHTALHGATQAEDLKYVKLLIAKGADVDALNVPGDTPVDRVCFGEYIAIIKLLISQGARIIATQATITVSARHGNLDLLAFLLDNEAEAMPQNEQRPELLCVAGSSNPKVFHLLVERGFGSQEPRSLLRAVMYESVQVVALLIDGGVNVHTMDAKQHTLLHRAVLSKRLKVKHKWGVSNSRDEVIIYLVRKRVNIAARDIRGKTALDLANELG